jgi:hypothetical protein
MKTSGRLGAILSDLIGSILSQRRLGQDYPSTDKWGQPHPNLGWALLANNAALYSAGGLDSGAKQELGEFCRMGGRVKSDRPPLTRACARWARKIQIGRQRSSFICRIDSRSVTQGRGYLCSFCQTTS